MGKIEDLETINGEGYQLTNLDKAIALARANSVWPLPFATSCCGIEFMATMGSHYDLARFGSERVGFSPRQCDLLMVMGTIAKKMGPVVKQVYLQMAEPTQAAHYLEQAWAIAERFPDSQSVNLRLAVTALQQQDAP